MKFRLQSAVAAVAVAAGLFVFTTPANATLTLSVTENGNPVGTLTDPASGVYNVGDLNFYTSVTGGDGSINFEFTAGSNGFEGIYNNSYHIPTTYVLTLTNTFNSVGAGDLDQFFQDFSYNNGGHPGDTVSATWSVTGGGTYSSSVPSAYITPTGPFYTMTEVITLTYTDGGPIGALDGSLSVSPVPEPASIALLGGVLLFACLKLRRRFGTVTAS